MLFETIRALGYTPEGGFPKLPGDAPPVPPAIAGTIQDLSTMRRLDLIVGTQREIMTGAGLQMRGHSPDRLEAVPSGIGSPRQRDATGHTGAEAPTA